MERPLPRTLLERLIQESDRTLEETCRAFERCARELGERTSISMRQLGRWMAGEVDNARPASRRVAQRFWGYTFQELLCPPPLGSIEGQSVEVAAVSHTSLFPQHGQLGESGTLAASLQEEIVMAADESARFVRRSGLAITPEVIEQLNADVHWLAVQYLRQPPYTVFLRLAHLRRDVFEMIERHPRPELVTDLYRVAGQLSALLAHASNDLGQPYAADTHARTAWLCADLSGDERLRAYIRWVQSSVAYWRGDYRDAVELAQSGQRYAGEASDTLRLVSQEARASAAVQDERQASSALARSADLRSTMTEPGQLAGVFYFSRGKASYYASETRLALGGPANHQRAAVDAQESLAYFRAAPEDQSPELVAAAQLDLALAHLALNDLDAVSEHAQPVLGLPAESRTVPIIGRVAILDRALAAEPYRGVLIARDLRDQITPFRAYPASRELPQYPE